MNMSYGFGICTYVCICILCILKIQYLCMKFVRTFTSGLLFTRFPGLSTLDFV